MPVSGFALTPVLWLKVWKEVLLRFNAAANKDSLCKSPQSSFDSSVDWLWHVAFWCNTERTLSDHFQTREGDNSVNTFVVLFRVIAWLASTCSIWCSNKKDSSVYTFAVNFVVVRDMNCSKNSCSIISLRPCPFGTVGSYPYWVNLVFIDAGSHLHRTV